jgi:hypothetical protein
MTITPQKIEQVDRRVIAGAPTNHHLICPHVTHCKIRIVMMCHYRWTVKTESRHHVRTIPYVFLDMKSDQPMVNQVALIVISFYQYIIGATERS